MTIRIKAKENIMGAIKKGEIRNVANNFGLLMIKQGKAELIDFNGSDDTLQNVNERGRREKILKEVGLEVKVSYTQLQVVELIEKLLNKEEVRR